MPATSRRPSARPLLVRVVVALVLTATSLACGIAMTAVWPTTVTTRQYSADVSLSAAPSQRSTVHTPTLFGDLDIAFGSVLPAPGITANVQVRDSIASVLASSGVDIRSLQPTSAELDEAMRSAAWRVGGKLLLGIALAALLAWALLRGQALVGGLPALTAAALALIVAAAGLGSTYRPASFSAVRTTGLLSLVRANAGLLGDVEKRSAQATPYVRNMLALTAALQEKYTPSEIATGDALKIIAISDVHGANQYPLLRSLVQSEGAHAVIDTGDLINFGSVKEAEAAGLFTGIRSLGVPYLFVRGNHDAHSPTDDDLVQALRKIPNVIVLEPAREKTYTVASIGGLRFAGFGDPRWFGDGGENTGEMQKPAVAAFTAAMKGLRDGTASTDVPAADRATVLDVVLGHEPAAVEGLAGLARLRINGHMHSQGLEGSRIALGTFSGGGVVSHYIQSADGSELAGEPFSFDVLSFASSCHLASLTRYQFTNMLEGRPTYDTVQVVNGSSIEAEPPGEGRTCSTTSPTQTWTVQAPQPADGASATPTPTVTTP